MKVEEQQEVCTPVAEDTELLEELEKRSATSVYAGSIKFEGAYKDLYVVIMPDRSVHVVEVRRLCHRG